MLFNPENLLLSDPKTTLFYQNYNFEKTKKNAESGFSRGVSRATERFFFSQTASVLPDPTRTHAVGFIRPLFRWLILFRNPCTCAWENYKKV